jgi:hypothetical protein
MSKKRKSLFIINYRVYLNKQKISKTQKIYVDVSNEIKNSRNDDDNIAATFNSHLDFMLKRSISTNSNIPKNSILLKSDKDFRIKRNLTIAKNNKPITLTPFQVFEMKKSSDKDKVKKKILMNKLELFKEQGGEQELKKIIFLSPNHKKENNFDPNLPSICNTIVTKTFKLKNNLEGTPELNKESLKNKMSLNSINNFLSKKFSLKKSETIPIKRGLTFINKFEKTILLSSPRESPSFFLKYNAKESKRNLLEAVSFEKFKLTKTANMLFHSPTKEE